MRRFIHPSVRSLQSSWSLPFDFYFNPPCPPVRPVATTETCYILVDVARSLAELYDARREKPSVLVTSPGSPDLHAQGRGRHSRYPTGNTNVGGSIQVKLGFDPVAFQLIVTVVCAAGLMPKSSGQPRNPYAKLYLLPDRRWVTKALGNMNSDQLSLKFDESKF